MPADVATPQSARTSVVVVGAGAAGLVAAITAATEGASVTLVERTADGGRKILISGGGRCNILPSAIVPERFVSDAPSPLVRRLLKSWPLREQRLFFEDEVGILLALESESGKLFPRSNRARDVRDGLVALARTRGVDFAFGTSVTGLSSTGGRWTLETSSGALSADRVILATGGLSVPATGSDGTGLQIARALGHTMVPMYPALTPLIADPAPHAVLSGLSLPVRLRARSHARSAESSGGFLFTHRGYSGPAVLDVSHIVTRAANAARSAASVFVRWSPLDASAWSAELAGASGAVSSVLGRHLPARLAEQLMVEASVPVERRLSEFRRSERLALIECLTAYPLPWTDHEGYKKAEVTGGGVALDDVDSRSLESRRCPGLFLCGEMLDAFGPIGGHNFAWAWSTGHTAGRAAAHAPLR